MKDPAFLFYSSDFLTGTYTMTDEQVGKYIRLLCLQHQHGHLLENHMVLVCKTYDKAIYDKFIQDENGLYYNERLEIETEKRQNYIDSRRSNGVKGGRPSTNKNHKDSICKPYGKPSNNHTENENVNENEDVIDSGNDYSFNRFWFAYPRKIAKADAQKAFKKINMTAALFDAILSSLEKWKKSKEWTKDGGQFIPHAATWLNGKRWEDEDNPIIAQTEEERIRGL